MERKTRFWQISGKRRPILKITYDGRQAASQQRLQKKTASDDIALDCSFLFMPYHSSVFQSPRDHAVEVTVVYVGDTDQLVTAVVTWIFSGEKGDVGVSSTFVGNMT